MVIRLNESTTHLKTLRTTKFISSILQMYKSTSADLAKIAKKPATSADSTSEALRRLVKDVTTRHGLGTTDWLLDHVHASPSEPPSSVDEVLVNHFEITLLGEAYEATCKGKGRGAVRRVGRGEIIKLIKEAVEETSFLTSVAFPDDFVEVVVEEGEDGDEDEDIDMFVVPSSFRYIIMEGEFRSLHPAPNIRSSSHLFKFGQKAEKFDRLDHQTSYAALPHDPMEGVGVGLSLSRILARRDGGDVSLLPPTDSSGGAEFVLTMGLISPDKVHPAYLHISPSGDAWVSPELFAAKHLNNDYVRSFGPVDEGTFDVDDMDVSELNDLYDTGGEQPTPWSGPS
ncbi:hypothetical protein TrRE_jg4466 [Triparma retinervis]|uniref:Uncharacterized protein n=1 Tax=Triparma retinervis TaxID=2557542 RepID=A0A9W7B080_9STRA|nr:hypothetical protein TrRE_jg4466 [Triparma retinervis]